MSEISLDQLSGAKPVEEPKQGKTVSFESAMGREGPSDAETAKAAVLSAVKDFPTDWKENSWTWAITQSVGEFAAKQNREVLRANLQEQIDASGDENAKKQLAKLEAEEGQERFIAGRKAQRDVVKDRKKPGVMETVKKAAGEVVESAKERPLTTAVVMAKSLVYDAPLFAATGAIGLPGKVAQLTEAVSKAKGVAGAAKATTAAAEGFGLGYGGSAAEQYQKKGKVDTGEAVASGAMIAALDVGARTLGGLIPKRKVEESRPGVKKEPAPLEPEFTPEEHRQARKVIEDEHDWGTYNAAVRDHEALKGSWDEVQGAVEEGRKATEQTGEWFRKDVEPSDPVTVERAQELLAKPRFKLLTSGERTELKRWQMQAMVAGSAGMAYMLGDEGTKKEIAAAGVMGAAVVPGFYARAPRLVEKLGRKTGTAAEWKAELEALGRKGGGVKDELDHTSALEMLNAWPDKSAKIPKEQVMSILRDNAVELTETTLGGELSHEKLGEMHKNYTAKLERKYGKDFSDRAKWTPEERKNMARLSGARPSAPTRYSDMPEVNLPGGERPREILLQVPGVGFEHAHWKGVPDVVAHIRFNERLDPDGKRVMFVEEIQSDLAQEHRKWEKHAEDLKEEEKRKKESVARWRRGEAGIPEQGVGTRLKELKDQIPATERKAEEFRLKARETPFTKDTDDWTSLSLRRILRYAADNGYSRIAFTTPEQMAKRVGEAKGFPTKYYGETIPRVLNKIMKTLGGKAAGEHPIRLESEASKGSMMRVLEDHGYRTEKRGDGLHIFNLVDQEVPISRLPEDLIDTADTLNKIYRGEMKEPSKFEFSKQPSVELTPEISAKIQSGFAMFDRQGGKMHTELTALLAGAGLGALIGGNINEDSPIMGAAVGAAVGLLGGRVLERVATHSFAKDIPELIKGEKASRQRIEGVINDHQHFILRAQRDVMQLQEKVFKTVPQEKRREVMAQVLDGKEEILSADEQRMVGAIKAHMDALSRAALDVGILDDVRHVFTKQMFDRIGSDPRKLAEHVRAVESGQEAFTFLRGGQNKGLSPVSTDVAAILGTYTNAVARSVANKRMIDVLGRDGRVPDGNGAMLPLMMSAQEKNFPAGYKTVDRPMLHGKRVHPDIVPELGMLFDTKDPDAWVRAASAVSTASKRAKVSFSLFHATALTQAMIGSSGSLKLGVVGAGVGAGIAAATGTDMLTGAEFGLAAGIAAPVLAKIPGFATGRNALLKQVRDGGAGDLVDSAQRAGLKFSFERSTPVVGDVTNDFYQGLQSLQGFMDKFVHPVAGKAVKGIEDVNHAIDNVMWGRLHAGMKLTVWDKTKSKLISDNAKARDRSPEIPILTEERAGQVAASYANSLFGGLNWVKLMEGVQSRWGRQVASDLMGPTGQRYMGILMFAPDWTISTTLSAVRALDIRPSQKELADLHRMYMMRAALWTVGLGEALNYTMSGHHLWENKDPTVVDLADGWTMQLSKHFYEPFHWLQKPGQQALNKLGVVPQESAKQLSGSKWLSTKGAPKMSASERVESVLKQFVPFSMPGTMDQEGVVRGVSGATGVPVYPPRKKKRRTAEDRLADAEKTE